MIHTNSLPEWLVQRSMIIGAEGDEANSGSDDSGDDDAPDDQSQEAGDAAGASSSSSGSEHDDADDPDVKGLKTALAAERSRAKALEKENRKLAKAREERELGEKTEVEQAKIREEKANTRAQALSAGLLRREINSAIEKAAREAGFIDPEDAISGVDRTQIEYDQDEDDPSDISISQKAVVAQVKALAARKPHFIRTGTDDGLPSGSQFGGKGKKKGNMADEDLKARYPSLR